MTCVTVSLNQAPATPEPPRGELEQAAVPVCEPNLTPTLTNPNPHRRFEAWRAEAMLQSLASSECAFQPLMSPMKGLDLQISMTPL